MIRFTQLVLIVSSTALIGLTGCSGGSEEGTGTPTSSSSGSDGSAEKPAKSSDSGSPAPEDDEASVGPQCTEYFACCEEIAKSQPALAGSCDSTRTAVESATKKGASTASYESACEQALTSMQSAGYCK
jgi:hypothetical protein